MRSHALFLGVGLSILLPPLGWTQTIRLEAEDARLEGPSVAVVQPAAATVDTNLRAGYSGTGYVTGFFRPTDRVVFEVKVAAPGVYDLRIGYACASHKGFALDVNGLRMTDTFPASVDAFTSHGAGKVELNAGANTLSIGGGWGHYDIDYVELSPAASSGSVVRPAATTSDSQATVEAQALLTHLDDTYGSGMMLGVYSDQDAKFVADTTHFRPAIMGGDLMKYSPSFAARLERPANSQEAEKGEIERLIARAAEGYLITLSWHWAAPFGLIDAMVPDPKGGPPADERWYKGFYTKATTFDVAVAMADPASKEHVALVHDIDQIAVQLRRLDAAGIPVLWRPLHEAEGGWFWWGAKGPAPFIALWRMMYDRLVNVDGVHNLVWVYTSGGDPAWYPGDDVVDVVGIDAYPEDLRDPQTALWEELERQFGGRKLLAISEYGGVPDIERMQRLGAYWAYAVSWSGDLGPRKNGPDDLRRIYAGEGALKMPAAQTETLGAQPSAATVKPK